MAGGSGKRFSRPAGMHRSGGPWSRGNARHQLGRAAQSLQHDAIALGQFQEAVDALLRLVSVEREGEADRVKADRRGAVDPERAAEIEIALGPDRVTFQAEFSRCLDGAPRYPGTAAEFLQLRIARAG